MSVTFNPATDIPSLTGKVILITGGNAGLGSATVEALAAHNPECIYLTSRRAPAGAATAEAIHSKYPDASIKVLPLDLNSLSSVRSCAEEFLSQSKRLDILILNAGIAGTTPALTADGYEHQFGVNHIGHAMLTQLLMPTLLATSRDRENADVRVVVLSSVGARTFAPKAGLVLETMKTDGGKMGLMERYGHSKLANALFAKSLAQKYPQILSTAVHPGTVLSEIWDKGTALPGWLAWLLKKAVEVRGVSTTEGAKTQLWAATARREEVENGGFYQPVAKLFPPGEKFFDQRQQLADQLWDWTNTELEKQGGKGWPEA